MTIQEILLHLKSLGDGKVRAHNQKFGAGENQYGVKMGDIRALAKKIKVNHQLALELWETGNVEARFLAILIMKPQELKRWTGWCVPKNSRILPIGSVLTWLNCIRRMKHCAKCG